MSAKRTLRCAVYTRKSSEEGLDQAFNSLDAQRDACAAYIMSQAGLGWKLVADHYDDGGISGGTLERPALQRLLQDVRDRKIDVVVVYKIDRLTRSLTDFAKIVEVFDASDISFVSVTQQFNTTTSMGRLTLNVLLSFAQFEREVTAERIRDKIAASKRKGIWMGGTVPLGYAVRQRKLFVKEPEASFVRGLFVRYLELRSVPSLAAEVTRQAIAMEQSGETDQSFAGYSRRVGSGMLYKLLANPIYIGKLRHRGNVYDGEHQPIVDTDQFERVQHLLAAQAATPRGSRVQKDVHLLTGLLFDDSGDRMSPSHAKAHGKRFRYYVSSRIRKAKRADGTGWRIPAPVIETVVLQFARKLLSDRARLSDWIHVHAPSSDLQAGLSQAQSVGAKLADEAEPQRRAILAALFHKISLATDVITFDVNTAALVRLVLPDNTGPTSASPEDDGRPGSLVSITLPIRIKRRGSEMRMVIDSENKSHDPDPALVNLVARSHLYLERMTAQPSMSISDIADQFGVHRADVGRLLPLAILSPRIHEQIHTGRHPVE
jgi:DNA invertase Pin-like site-specific DNA recombinase